MPQPARAAAQGLSDLTMNTSAGVGGAAAGLIVAQAGYGWLNLIAACLLLPLGALALFTRGKRKAGAAISEAHRESETLRHTGG